MRLRRHQSRHGRQYRRRLCKPERIPIRWRRHAWNPVLAVRHLRGASFIGATATSANFSYAHLQGANFQGAELTLAQLSYAGLDGASLVNSVNCWLERILRGETTSGSNLSFVILIGATLDNALAQNALFIGAQMQGASFASSHLNEANLLAASVYGANFTNTAGSYRTFELLMCLTDARWNLISRLRVLRGY